jgi:hypothetical protein
MLGFPITAAMFSKSDILPALEHDDFQMLFIATLKPRCRVVIKHT